MYVYVCVYVCVCVCVCVCMRVQYGQAATGAHPADMLEADGYPFEFGLTLEDTATLAPGWQEVDAAPQERGGQASKASVDVDADKQYVNKAGTKSSEGKPASLARIFLPNPSTTP